MQAWLHAVQPPPPARLAECGMIIAMIAILPIGVAPEHATQPTTGVAPVATGGARELH